MFKKLKGHELVAGEKLAELRPYYDTVELKPTVPPMSFVQDWEALTPKFKL